MQRSVLLSLSVLVASGMALAQQGPPPHALSMSVGAGVQYNSRGIQLIWASLTRWAPGVIELDCSLGALRWHEQVELARSYESDRTGAFRYTTQVGLYLPGDLSLASIPLGAQHLDCSARVLDTDERASAGADATIALPDHLPNVGFAANWAEASDCESGAVPVATRPVCVRLHVEGSSGYADVRARCTLGGSAASAEAHERVLELRMPRVAPGRHRLECRLELTGPAYEANLTNNAARTTVLVRRNAAEWRYDLSVTSVDSITHRALLPSASSGGCAPMREWGHALTVRVRDAGRDRVAWVEVTCRAGDLVLSGHDDRAQSGRDHAVEIDARALPLGTSELECEARPGSPHGVRDQTPANGSRHAHVSNSI